MMSPQVRKLLLVSHLTVSVGWIGAVLVYLALGVVVVNSSDEQLIRSLWVALEVAGWYVITPLAVAASLTGTLMALGTRWGLFRHYWVAISFALTVASTAVLLLHMPTVSAMADTARSAEGPALAALGGDLGHASAALVVLLLVQGLNVYKPRGVTAYGHRALMREV